MSTESCTLPNLNLESGFTSLDLRGQGPDDAKEGADKTDPYEIWSVYAYNAGGAPLATVLLIFLPLLILTQAKYEASTNDEFIEWREDTISGDLCGGSGSPAGLGNYTRPEDYLSKCAWFPVNKKVPQLNLDYTAVMVFANSFVLAMTAMVLLTFGPIPDYASVRKPMLMVSTAVWIAALACIPAFSSTATYTGIILLAAVATVAWVFSFKSALNGYITIVVWNSPALVELRGLVEHDPALIGAQEEALQEAPGSHAEDAALHKYLQESEKTSVQITMTASTYFVASEIFAMIVQIVLVVWLEPAQDEPKDTLGVRMAILSAVAVAAPATTVGIWCMKNRKGPVFPEGNLLCLGASRMLHTSRIMRRDLRMLLQFMVGRCLVWLTMGTLVTSGVLFLEREFSYTASDLAPLLFLFLVICALSNMACLWMNKHFSGFVLKAICGFSIVSMTIPIYMLVGLTQEFEVFILFVVGASVMSPYSGMSRSFMIELIPEGLNSAVLSLDALMDTVTAWIGPLLTGIVLSNTGSLRWGIFTCIIFAIVGTPLLCKVDAEVGRQQKKEYEKANPVKRKP